MNNPWLTIPASDYEGHMGSPDVDQLSFLSAQFKEAIERYPCESIALLGCTTGNGLEHLERARTRRITAVDLNPEYLEILKERYGDSVAGLEVVQADLEKCELEKQAYSLIFAGLVFEYLDPRVLLGKIAGWLVRDGVFVVILQMLCDRPTVTDTPYTSIRSLNSIMNLVDTEQFRAMAADAGLSAIEETMIALETGKSFYRGIYTKSEKMRVKPSNNT